MKVPRNIRPLLWKVLVKEFYRQNAGFFLFFFLLFFGVIAPSQQLNYHYSLIRGILSTPVMLALVLFIWLLYAGKCARWVTGVQQSPDHAFLQMLSLLGKAEVFRLFLEIQAVLYLPVTLYAMAIIGVGLHESAGGVALLVIIFIVLVCIAGAALYQYSLFHPGSLSRLSMFTLGRKKGSLKKRRFYWTFLMRSFFAGRKVLLAGIKLFGCGILYLLLGAQASGDVDIRMPFLIFSLVLFGHGVLIYQMRQMEEHQLLFYRGMPVSLANRLLQYVILYFLLMLPETITLCWLMPGYIRVRDALGIILAGTSTLLLLNSCLFTALFRKGDFLKLSLGIFGILYFGALSDALILLSGLFFVVAGGLFFRGYCRWEG